MTDPVIYRSRTPEVPAAWKAACEALSAYIAATQAILDEAGFAGWPAFRNNGSWSYGKIAGIGVPDSEEMPDGWRAAKHCAVPDKRTKAGREMQARLDAVKHPGALTGHLPGMAADVLNGMSGYIVSPDIRVLGESVYAEWSADPERAEVSFSNRTTQVDHDLWERVKLSDYYAEREAEDERRAAEKVTA